MFKKILSLVLVAVMCVGACMAFASCGDDEFKIGVILLHDENSTYDLNFMNGVEAAIESLGMKKSQLVYKKNIPESEQAYEAACDLAESGCKLVFADSFGHEEYILKAAKEYPNVQFCHATGTMAHTENVSNFHNAFASIYEGRYLAGVAAGMKLNEMIANGTTVNGTVVTAENAKIGYVGAFTYAEVMSGYTSFYLGAKSVCPTVTMDVTFTGSWYDETKEKSAALTLINSGCNLISQHADSMGAPAACEEKGVPNVSYNGSTLADCPNTFIVSSRIDWSVYFKYIIDCAQNDKQIATDWTGTLANGAVALTDVNTSVAAAGTVEKLNELKTKLNDGTLKVFDTATFTVNGEVLTTYMADVDTDADFTAGTEAVKDGYFHESEYRSAPYFNVEIDGITLLDRNYGD